MRVGSRHRSGPLRPSPGLLPAPFSPAMRSPPGAHRGPASLDRGRDSHVRSAGPRPSRRESGVPQTRTLRPPAVQHPGSSLAAFPFQPNSQDSLRLPGAGRGTQGVRVCVCASVCVCVCVCVAAHLGRANVTVCGGGMLAQGGALGYLLLLLFPRGGRGRTGTSDLCPIPHPPARPTAWMRATSSEDTRALTPATHPSQLGEERQPTSDGWCAPSSLCPLTAGREAAGWVLPDVGVQFSTTGSGCFQGYWRVFRLPGSQGATKSNIQISLISWTWRVQ